MEANCIVKISIYHPSMDWILLSMQLDCTNLCSVSNQFNPIAPDDSKDMCHSNCCKRYVRNCYIHMCDSNCCKKLVRLFKHSVERRPDDSLQSRIHYCRTSSISRFVYRQRSAVQSEIDHCNVFFASLGALVLSITYL